MYQNQYAEEVLSDEGALMIRRGKLQALTIGETDVLGEHIFEAVRTGLGRGTYPGGILTL
ncbi:MAG: hypothetical protein GWN57_17805, partial [Nitrospinaceae bacterium]|nr:hypothetical protein [Nitrospinaceae bacterium]